LRSKAPRKKKQTKNKLNWMRFFTLWALLVLDPRLMHQSSLQKPLRTLLGSSDLVVGKRAIAQRSCCENNPREDDALQDVDRFAGPRAPAAAGGVVERRSSFVHKPQPNCFGTMDENWMNSESSTSMQNGCNLMKSPQFSFNEIWMTNLDEKFTIHFQ